MPVKAKDIDGFLVSYKAHAKKQPPNCEIDRTMGFNFAIDEQGEVLIGLNKEKLARIICGYTLSLNPLTEIDMIQSLELADSIIAQEHKLIELKADAPREQK